MSRNAEKEEKEKIVEKNAEKNAAVVKAAENKEADETAVKVEAIRHILEEFLAW